MFQTVYVIHWSAYNRTCYYRLEETKLHLFCGVAEGFFGHNSPTPDQI